MLSLDFISLSHRFLEFIMMFHEFWLSVPSLYHQIFISLPHQSLRCTIHFHQFFPPACDFFTSHQILCVFPNYLVILSSAFIIFAHPFLDFFMGFQSIFPTYLFIFSLGFIRFPHVLAHFITRFYLFSPLLPLIRGFHPVPFLLQCVMHYLYLISL